MESPITISRKEYDNLKRGNSDLKDRLARVPSQIVDLQIEIELLRNGRKSNTSFQDYGRSNKYNLREKNTEKSGGQKERSLKMSGTSKEIQQHIPPIKAKFIEHQPYSSTSSRCNTQTTSGLASRLKANMQHGNNAQTPADYLSVYQYMPSNRTIHYLKGIMSIFISEGTIYTIIKFMSIKGMPAYELIKEKIAASHTVDGNESVIKNNGDKAWFRVFRNSLCTFIKAALSRRYRSIVETFSNGFPILVYVSDRLSAQLKIDTKAKQLCLAHLMRELKSFEAVLY